MIKHIVEMMLAGSKAERFYDFMVRPADEVYRQWLPGEHLEFHVVSRGKKSPLGDEIYFDEYLNGRHRLKFHATVIQADRPRKIVWQMRKLGVKLPAWLDIKFHDSDAGMLIRHELRIGCAGVGRLLDPILKLYLNRSFWSDLEIHCHNEWPALAKLLNDRLP
jgi:hypothetical protein